MKNAINEKTSTMRLKSGLLGICVILSMLLVGLPVYAGSTYSDIKIHSTSSNLLVGATATIQVKATPTAGGEDVDLSGTSTPTYSSSNTAVATVSDTGLVTALTRGTATITVTADGITKKIIIVVYVATDSSLNKTYEVAGDISPAANGALSTAQFRSGTSSVVVNNVSQYGIYYYSQATSTLAEMWFYDDLGTNSYAMAKFQNNDSWIQDQVGLKGGTTYFFSGNNGDGTNGHGLFSTTTAISRTLGWHQIIADYTQVNTISYYIDGTLFKSRTNVTPMYKQFNTVSALGVPATYTYTYADDLRTYNFATKPVASNVTISGTVNLGNTLTAGYTYSDLNSDVENGSTYKWLSRASGQTAWTEIATGTTTATLGSTYVVQASDVGKVIKFEITPKNGALLYNGTPANAALDTTTATGLVVQSLSISSDGYAISKLAVSQQTPLVIGSTATLEVTATYPDTTTIDYTGSSVPTYSSSNTNIATVSESGLITAISKGITKITVTKDGADASIFVIIVETNAQTTPSYSYDYASGANTTTAKYRSEPSSWTAPASGSDANYFVGDKAGTTGLAEMWFYDDVAISNYLAYFEIRNVDSSAQYRLGLKGGTQYWFETSAAWGTNTCSNTILRTTGWHQIIADYTVNGTITFYIDGVVLKQLTGLASGYKSLHSLMLKTLTSYSGYTGSYIDDIKVYDLASRPLAQNVQISGDLSVGQTLTGSYSYYDANGDAEGSSTYRWLSATSPSGPWMVLSSGTTTASTGATYVVNAADTSKYIQFEITPKNVPSGVYRLYYDTTVTPNKWVQDYTKADTITNIGTPKTLYVMPSCEVVLQFVSANLAVNTPISATAQVTKTTETTEDYILILAVYNGNKLYSVATQQKTVTGTTPQSYTASSIVLPADITNFSAKAFMWTGTSMDTMIPVARSIQLN
jgi:hypothetical protein